MHPGFLAPDFLARMPAAAPHGDSGRGDQHALSVVLSRSRSCLPVLKNGMCFSETWTLSPVRGLRPTRASRRFTEKAPKPRSSTRSPRARAAAIS
jgi:hypothetical protein